MFFLLPIGVEDHTVDRVPWVSLGIAGLSLLAFLLTWVLPGSSRAELVALQKVAHYWDAHPYLAPPADRGHSELPTQLLPSSRGVRQLGPTPPESEVADQQQQLDALIGSYLDLSARNPLRRYGLVPARSARGRSSKASALTFIRSSSRPRWPFGSAWPCTRRPKACAFAARTSSRRPRPQAERIGLQEHAEPSVVRGQLQRARAMEGLSPELIARLTALEGQLPPEAELALPETDLPAKVLPPRLQPCRLLAVSGSDLGLIDATGKRTILPLRDIWALAVGVVRVGVAVGEPGRKVLVLDLSTAAATAEAGASGRRLTSDPLVPQHFYPTLTPAQGYAALLELIARVSGAALLPDAEALRRGTYASFETLAAFETAVYGIT